MPKRYIEDVLPLGELNKYAQKGGGIGSLNAMHPYFARRPLTASRAEAETVGAQLVNLETLDADLRRASVGDGRTTLRTWRNGYASDLVGCLCSLPRSSRNHAGTCAGLEVELRRSNERVPLRHDL